MNKLDSFNYKGKQYDIFKSTRKNKQLMVRVNNKLVHFGDPSMREYPGTKRGDAYCARSFGIGNVDNVESANFWSRKYLWNCKGKKSIKKIQKVYI